MVIKKAPTVSQAQNLCCFMLSASYWSYFLVSVT